MLYPLSWHRWGGGGLTGPLFLGGGGAGLFFLGGGGGEAFDQARLEINLDFIASCLPNHVFEQMVI